MSLSVTGQYVKGIAAGGLAESVRLGLPFLNFWFVTQLLTKEDFGARAFSYALLGLVDLISTAGLEQALLFRASTHQPHENRLVLGGFAASVLVVTLAIAALFSVLFLLFGFFFGRDFWNGTPFLWFCVAAVLLPINTISTVLSTWLVANQRAHQARLVSIASPVLFTSGVLWIWLLQAGRVGVAIVTIGSSLFATLFWLLFIRLDDFRGSTRPQLWDLRYGLKIMLSRLVHIAFEKIDILMLTGLLGAATTAEYAVATRIAFPSRMGNLLISPVFLPRMRQSIAMKDRGRLDREYAQNRLFTVSWSCLFLIALLFLRPVFLILFPQYAAAWKVSLVLGGAHLVRASFGLAGTYLQLSGRASALLLASLCTLTSAVLLNLLLIPHFGAIGAAVASLASLAITNIIIAIGVWRQDNLSTISPALSLLAFGFAGAVLAVVRSGAGAEAVSVGAIGILATILFLQRDHWLPAARNSVRYVWTILRDRSRGSDNGIEDV